MKDFATLFLFGETSRSVTQLLTLLQEPHPRRWYWTPPWRTQADVRLQTGTKPPAPQDRFGLRKRLKWVMRKVLFTPKAFFSFKITVSCVMLHLLSLGTSDPQRRQVVVWANVTFVLVTNAAAFGKVLQRAALRTCGTLIGGAYAHFVCYCSGANGWAILAMVAVFAVPAFWAQYNFKDYSYAFGLSMVTIGLVISDQVQPSVPEMYLSFLLLFYEFIFLLLEAPRSFGGASEWTLNGSKAMQVVTFSAPATLGVAPALK